MSVAEPTANVPPDQEPSTEFAVKLGAAQRAGGIVVPVLTAVLAFLAGGIVVAATGHNPWVAYHGIWDGAGFNWLFHFPWDTNVIHLSAFNFSQTLLTMTTLILVGLAVAFPFRCGLFNIGGQGQYLVGLIVANWVGVSFASWPTAPHVLLGIVAATFAGAVWAGIAGFLKATTGAHEVITTIMLNWIAIWGGQYLFGQGGPLQNTYNPAAPESGTIANSAHIPVFWGSPVLQGLDYGFFIAIGALVLFWFILNRTTLGFEVRAVGFNPDAAAYSGIDVRKKYIQAMAISGAFAGLAGALDMLGYLFQYGQLDVQNSQIGFLGIAVALLGRNTAVGVGISAFLFGGLLYGTTRGLNSNVFDPSLAGNLTSMIQGLIVLFVGADILILYVWNARRKVRLPHVLQPEPDTGP
jgi:general nucleoside transport system permease protein